MAAPQLIWEVVKGHNSFLRKNLNGTRFSAEAGNLYNKHSYKYSGEHCAGWAASCAALLQVLLLAAAGLPAVVPWMQLLRQVAD
jgi:hypothetical protein